MKGPIRQEIRPEEQCEKMESCRENLWNEIQLKGRLPKTTTRKTNKQTKNHPEIDTRTE